ncbi:MAG TPA: type 2 lanthipeptide synthetase LanM family protein, partial [Thermoanaerobaculia bacterium]|nr:type 2 lanthipeptide synthetase LanM family protein [Thermoanaerobaculia bacterium]
MISDLEAPTLSTATAAWPRALTLAERIARLRGGAQLPPAEDERSARRLARWRAQNPFPAGPWFAERLAVDGLSESEFQALLAPASVPDGEEPPRWWQDLMDACSRPPGEVPPLELGEMAGLFPVVAPLLAWKLERVRARIAEIASRGGELAFDPETVERLLLLSLPERLVGMFSRTLVLEMHVARLEGRLAGETPEERFASFAASLTQPGGLANLLDEYPVLGRQALQRANLWLDFSLEFLEHLQADRDLLRETFAGGADPGPLTALQGGLGDRHRAGREVLIAAFASGLKVVYKPRSLAVDVHVQELLGWLNAQGQEPPFRLLRVLDRGAYGWMELVSPAPAPDRDAVHRFYQRQGAYLALLYAIEASDFHSENLIAAGEHPVLIDLESLFQARVEGMDVQQPDLVASHVLGHSVLRVGLLPQRVWGNEEQEGIDMSGLGSLPGQLSPHGLPYWSDVGTDAMRLERRREEMADGDNRPRLASGEPVDLLDYTGALVAGFKSTYRRMMRHREELLEVLGRFAGDEVRAILRPTQSYGVILTESYHPDLLRDALDRDRLFDRLWVPIESRPYLARVFRHEREDLWNGDVPLFTTRPETRDLFSSTGERVPDFFDAAGLDLVRRRVERLSEEDLERQSWFLRASLLALTLDLDTALWPSYTVAPPRPPATRGRLLEAARAIGDHLERSAIRAAGEATWIGLVTEMGRHPSLVPLKLDLYSGLPGVALFLAHLGAMTGEERFTDLARSALAGIRRLVRKDPGLVSCIGGFGGWGGLIYTFAQLAVLWDEPSLLREAEEAVEILLPQIERDPYLDLIAGAAGCIGGLLALHALSPSERTLAAAAACGEHLLARAVPADRGGSGWLPTQGG